MATDARRVDASCAIEHKCSMFVKLHRSSMPIHKSCRSALWGNHENELERCTFCGESMHEGKYSSGRAGEGSVLCSVGPS